MKLSVSSYSFDHYKRPEELGLTGIMDKALELGFDAIEFAESSYINFDRDTALRIREHSEKISLPVISFAAGADFARNGKDGVEREIERVCAIVDTAAEMGVGMMRHDVWYGELPGVKNPSFEDVLPILTDACKKVTDYAREKGIKTMVENHGMHVQDSARVKTLIESVNDENFGALVDIGNFLCVDEDNIRAIKTVAPLAFHAHAKDFHKKTHNSDFPGEGWFSTRGGNYLRGAIVGHGVLDIPASINALKESGYDGYISLEFEGLEDNILGIRAGRDTLLRYIR